MVVNQGPSPRFSSELCCVLIQGGSIAVKKEIVVDRRRLSSFVVDQRRSIAVDGPKEIAVEKEIAVNRRRLSSSIEGDRLPSIDCRQTDGDCRRTDGDCRRTVEPKEVAVDRFLSIDFCRSIAGSSSLQYNIVFTESSLAVCHV